MAGFHQCVGRVNGVNEITVNKNINYEIFGRMEEREEENKVLTPLCYFAGFFYNKHITLRVLYIDITSIFISFICMW